MARLLGVFQLVREPVETLVESIARCRTRRLDVPIPLPQSVETQFVGDFGGVHGIRKILFVGKDKEDGVSEFILVQHPVELLPRLANSLSIVAIDHKDQSLGVGEIVSPERTDLVLTADVPNREGDVFVFYSFDVEPDGGYCCDDLAQFQFVENCCFTGSVESHHQNAHLSLAKEALEKLLEYVSHG